MVRVNHGNHESHDSHGRGVYLMALLLLSSPLALFALLRSRPDLDRVYAVPVQHFWAVSLTALAALLLAVVVGIVALRSRSPRTFWITTGFLVVAGVFSVHGLMTPGEEMLIHEMHNGITISARLSLFLGGFCFLLSTVVLPASLNRFIEHHHRRLFAATILLIAAFIAGNLLRPDLLDAVPTGQSTGTSATTQSAGGDDHSRMRGMNSYGGGYDSYGGPTPNATPAATTPGSDDGATLAGKSLNYGMAIIAGACLLLAAWRYASIYDLSRLPATGAMAAGLVLLAQSQISMTLGERWHLSWWLYHALMLAGFLIPIAGIGWAYRRGLGLNEIVEGLFLRNTLAKIERSFPEAMDELIAATVAKDPYLEGHSRRVCELTVAIGEQLGLPYEELRAAGYGALLHDIGKIGIPNAILQKPDRLTDDEYAVMKTHPMRGWHILMRAPSLREAAPTIRWHHERLNGTGYPDKLTAPQIPLAARIVAVADTWDALTSDRVYRAAWHPEAARRLLAREAGDTLDRACVEALFAILDRQPGTHQERPAMTREHLLLAG